MLQLVDPRRTVGQIAAAWVLVVVGAAFLAWALISMVRCASTLAADLDDAGLQCAIAQVGPLA